MPSEQLYTPSVNTKKYRQINGMPTTGDECEFEQIQEDFETLKDGDNNNDPFEDDEDYHMNSYSDLPRVQR